VLGGKTLSATVYTTNLKWIVVSSNPGLRVERPETNLLSHDSDNKNNVDNQLDVTITVYYLLFINSQFNMFRAMISLLFRSTRLSRAESLFLESQPAALHLTPDNQ
jgi:hypothetical protein